jgi:hypothetical protein
MRLLARPLAVVLLMVCAADAQAQEGTPDTTDATRYLPFHVGAMWEYERWRDECAPWPPYCDPVPDGFLRREVMRDTLFNGQQAWILRDRHYSSRGFFYPPLNYIVRYDSTEARAFGYSLSGESWENWPEVFYCRLDAPFFGDADCAGYAEMHRWEVFDEPVTVKSFVTSFASHHFVADIGLVATNLGDFAHDGMDIVYAHVNGVEYGTRFTVRLEPELGVPDPFGLAIHPNPIQLSGTLSLRMGAADHVRIEVFDMLGRRMAILHNGPLPGGEHKIAINAISFPAGTYVIRVLAEGHAAGVSFIVAK